MMMKWKKIEDEYLSDYYSLQVNEIEIAYLWYDCCSKKWILSPTIFETIIPKKVYKIPSNDIRMAQFKALLDLQTSFIKIANECSTYEKEIDSYINKYFL